MRCSRLQAALFYGLLLKLFSFLCLLFNYILITIICQQMCVFLRKISFCGARITTPHWRILQADGIFNLPLPARNCIPQFKKETKTMILDRISLILTIVGALNWGSIGLFQFDIVAWICGGQSSLLSRIIYTVVGLAGVWCISLLFRARETFDKIED
jgi:uncharacterized membrane protein YuzA (DUF378 family)